MEKTQIEKALAAFETKLKPIQKGKTTITAVKEEPAPVPAPTIVTPPPKPVAPSTGMCFTAPFKALIVALAEDYIGKNDSKLWILQQPDCEEVS